MIHCIDLFCGIGGLTHGLTRGGVKVLAGIDLDPQCSFPYEKNNAATFLERDITAIGGADLKAIWKTEKHTLLAGCAPCQPFSTYSRKGRLARRDTKWDLVKHFARLVGETNPAFITMENVPQLMDHPVFSEFLDALPSYHVWHKVIDCSQYGVPQTRKRLVLLASKLGPIALSSPGPSKDGDLTVRKAIGHLRTLTAGGSDPTDALHCACRLSARNLKRIQFSRPGGTWREWPRSLVARCHRHQSGSTYPSVYGRMEWDRPAPTMTTQCFGYGNGRFGHPDQNRAITLREAAILQTFPPTYQFLRDKERVRFSVLGRLIGNAVPVRLGEIVAHSFRRHLQKLNAKD